MIRTSFAVLLLSSLHALPAQAVPAQAQAAKSPAAA